MQVIGRWQVILVAMFRLSLAATTWSSPPLPTITPTIIDPDAPSTDDCPGYTAVNIDETEHGVTADLILAGPPCDVFGFDISSLLVEISYQAKERLNVRIQPKYIGHANRSRFILDEQFVRLPSSNYHVTKATSDLSFNWSNTGGFHFAVSRRHNGEVLLTTAGHALVFEDQFLELTTTMVPDYNVYGLGEHIRNFRLGTNYTQTLFNADTADAMDSNSYGTHPFYQETRYWQDNPSTAHGVYARNAHAQEWLLREQLITYRAIGGIIDLYFLSGQDAEQPPDETPTSSALEVIRQYQHGCVGLPAMQQYWTLGFHQCHWGWKSISDLREVVANYSAVGIPLESIWNDIDVYDRTRVFTNDQAGHPSDGMHEFVNFLHEHGQRYVAIQDSNVYIPDPMNETDVESYPPFRRGAEANAFIRDAKTGYFFIGENWPGYSVWADWLHPAAHDWWAEEVSRFHESVLFDGLWVDLNEPHSFCTYSCGNFELNGTYAGLPGGQSNLTSVDPRRLNFPPYKINNTKPTRQIIEQTIALDAFHNDQYRTREYDVHSLWSIGVLAATYNAVENIIPGKRPFLLARSTFAGSGQYAAHWGGDNTATWGAMYLSISQALTNQMAGIPMFGVDTCGFADDTTEELCARWMELSTFFPFFRNHYAAGKRPQEAYVWPTVAEASRRAISVRYKLLPYLYTLLYYAHARGVTMMRSLAWEFPDDNSLRDTDSQFLLGPSLLVTPVLEQGATSVNGVFPGIGKGTRWYDWYSFQEVNDVKAGENVTMAAPLEHINLHIRGGSILPMQEPGNTTAATRQNPYSLLVALSDIGSAAGTLYLDDGESMIPKTTKTVLFLFAEKCLTSRSWGAYPSGPPLANISITGLAGSPPHISLKVGSRHIGHVKSTYADGTLAISGLVQNTNAGAWEEDITLCLYDS